MEVQSSKPATKSMTDAEAQTKQKRKRRNVCLGVTAAVIVAVILVVVILALTVFKPRNPAVTVDSVAIKDLRVSLDIIRMGVDVNLSLDVDLSVKNPNKVGFKYTNSSAFLNYRGQLVGEVPIAAGKISADQTKPMNVTLILMVDRLISNSQLFSDAMSGVMPFNTLTKISGKVHIFNVFKIHVVSTSTCDFNVFVSNRTVGDQKCTYKTKL